jgi:hypothetical protein
VACPCANANKFFIILGQKKFVWQAFLQNKEKKLAMMASVFFSPNT